MGSMIAPVLDKDTASDGRGRTPQGHIGARVETKFTVWDPNAIGASGYPRWIEINMMLDFQIMRTYGF